MGRIIAADVLESRRDDWSISDDGALAATTPARSWRAPTLPADDSTPAVSTKARLTRSGRPDAYDFLRPKLGRPVLEPWEMDAHEAPPVPMSAAGSFNVEPMGMDRYRRGDAGMLVRFLARTDAGALDGWGGFSGATCQGLYDSLQDAGMPQSWYDGIGRVHAQLVGLLKQWSGGKLQQANVDLVQQKFSNLMAHATDDEKWGRFNDAKALTFKLLDNVDAPILSGGATAAQAVAALQNVLGGKKSAPTTIAPIVRAPMSPDHGAHKAEFERLWKALENHVNNQGGLLGDIGRAIGSAAESVGSAVSSVGQGVVSVAKGIATPVAALVTSPGRLVADLASGKNVFESLKDTVKRDLSSAKEIAPYVQAVLSVVPGVGTGINAAIAAGSALAQGQPITAALIAGLKGSLPGGPIAAQAFDTAYAVARGQNVGDAALQALVNNAPGGEIGKQAAQAAVAVAKGQNLQQAALGLAKGIASEKLGTLAPDVPGVVSSAARDLVSGRNVTDIVTSAAKGQVMANFSDKFSPYAVGILNQAGPRVANAIGGALPSILSADVRMVAQSLLTTPSLRNLPVDELARRLGTSTHVVRDGMGAVLQAVQKSGGASVPSLSYSKALAARVPTSMSFDGAMANMVSKAAPKVYSHNAPVQNGAARLRSAGMVYRAFSARGLDAGALDAKSMPTIRRGSSVDAVVQWQKILGVAADGKFGPNTESATIAFQKQKGLTADGIVGPQSWAVGLVTVATLPPLPPSSSSPTPTTTTTIPTPPPSAAPVLAQTMPMIRRGSEGPPVRTWQTFLKIPADGKFGPQTEEATRSFQARSGLVADGIVGPATWSKAMSGGIVPVATTPSTSSTPMGTPTIPPFFPPGNNPPGPPVEPPPGYPMPPGWNPATPPIITLPDPPKTTTIPQPAPPWGSPQTPPPREPGPIVVAPPPKQTQPKTGGGGGGMPTIRKGSTGDAVRTWQTFLKLRTVDGIFGPETEAATLIFQTKNGLAPDGIVGPLTWAAAARQQPDLSGGGKSAAFLPLLLLGGGALLLMNMEGKKHHRHARHARR